MKKVKVLVVDDHPIFRDGLVTALELWDDIEIVGSAGEGGEAVRKVMQFNPHVVLLDLQMPGMNGIDAAREIKNESRRTRIIVLSMHNARRYIIDALDTGIDGYILKMADVDIVHAAVKRVFDGDEYFDPEVTKIVKSKYSSVKIESKVNFHLTPREQEILHFITEGFSTPQIAEKLNISVFTVNAHRQNMIKKAAVKNTAELLKEMVLGGYFSEEAAL